MDQQAALEAHILQLLLIRPRVLVALDGMAASGKTTLAHETAARIPGCAVVHMDDFTLPFDQRFPGYFDASLSNADIDRFDSEVLSPLERGESARYRPYICHPEPGFLAPLTIPADTRVVIIEGAYCLHERLFDRYDLRILCTVSPDTQRARILARNGSEQLKRFESLWIPMENRHIAARNLVQRCDLVFSEG